MLHPLHGWLLLTLMVATAQSSRAQSPSGAPDSAELLFARGDLAAAEQAFTHQLADPSARPATRYNRALVRYHLRAHADALADLDLFLLQAPRSIPALTLRADVHLQIGNPAHAAADAAAALAIEPAHFDAQLLQARARAALGPDEQAEADFSHLLASAGERPDVLLARGDWHASRHRLDAAAADFARAVALDAADADGHFKLGAIRFRQLDLPAARQALQSAIELEPRAPALRRLSGLIHYASGDFPAAARELEQAVALDPAGSTYAGLMLQLTALRRGDTTLEHPVPEPTSPWSVTIHAFLLGNVSEDELFLAAQNLTPASARAGRICEANFFSGSLHLIRGDVRSARFALEQAAAANLPDFAEHTLARAELLRLPDPREPTPRPRRR